MSINDFISITNLDLIEYRVRRVICLQIPTVFWLVFSLSCSKYMGG
jgi:hypothetical protein